MAKSKKEMVRTGKIEDARIFKLMYLEKSVNEAKLLSELKKRAYNDQIEQLKNERQNVIRGFELRIKELTAQVAGIRSSFENDYDIRLTEWGYDDVTGILVPVNPEELKRITEQRALQKEIDAERSEEKKKRKSGKRKVKTNRWGTEQPNAEAEDEPKIPPSDPAEA